VRVRTGGAGGPSVACGAGCVEKLESVAGRALSSERHELSAGDEGIQRWLAGVRWRRRVERALKPLKLTLAQWRVLDAMARLIRESDDAVSQIQVARHIQMEKTTLCRVMRCLERRGLVDQAPEFSGTAYRIFLTEMGESLARQGRARVDGASADRTR
jgi:DNA-binding MarR family transcriptional regulator